MLFGFLWVRIWLYGDFLCIFLSWDSFEFWWGLGFLRFSVRVIDLTRCDVLVFVVWWFVVVCVGGWNVELLLCACLVGMCDFCVFSVRVFGFVLSVFCLTFGCCCSGLWFVVWFVVFGGFGVLWFFGDFSASLQCLCLF